ncbi:outer membrane beta-barrel protein [Photobacterium damselae]|uniref:outer membrane beta-barrel protein n=1 Tax=Photobacterium damselae TaxID=38293 RepID=UPI001EDEA18F|nr:outer membrane beta-barrel protein [Photobacterium damselae]ELV7515936.1 outer membrane beta-barrel protein [Photobacterium damselae]MCG3810958.1 outer membrane beta-barrel protein [Photobacterium damselae]MDC4167927.1 porin family protein [Photobacterium damselae]
MKKNALSLLVALAVIAPVAAQAAVQLPAGTQELGIQGNAKLGSGWDLNLNGSYGTFVKDNWEVGGTASVRAQDANDAISGKLGVFTEYNFVNSTNWVPYVGAATELAALSYSEDKGASGDLGKDGDSWALNIKLAAGVKYFINPNVALTAEANYNIATDDIDFSGDKAKDSLTNIVFGTRFYF